ncbi:MAG TPA: O-antigen ligase family protein [Caldilineaceae bacterium]|nr:O-antigen ligase family protein [Caldilineaceae bacterium]
MQARLEQVQRLLFSPDPLLRRAALMGLIALGAAAIALLIGIVGPLLALIAAAALVGGALVLADTHWGFVGLIAVAFGLPFASLPFSIGFKPTFLDVALGALFFVWLLKLAIGQERRFFASPLGAPVGMFMLLALFSFALGMTHSPANTFVTRRFVEILLGISLYFVAVNTVRTPVEVVWVTRWLMLAGWGAAGLAVLFYVIPEAWTVAILDRLARFDYPGGYGALRYIEDDPNGVMRAIGTAVDPNVLGGMMVLAASLVAPQLAAKETIVPRWLAALMLITAVLALYLTYSRSALLGFASALGLLAALKYRRLLWIGAVGALMLLLLPQTQDYVARLAAGFAGEDLATQMRFGEYKDALILISRYPFFGVGFTGVPDIDLYLGVSMLYLVIAEHMGFVGLAAFMTSLAGFFALVAGGWRRGFDARLEPLLLGLAGAVLGAMVSGIFDHYWFNMTYPHMTVLLWLYLGLAAATVLIQAAEREGQQALIQ